jgi:S1-C subfamily serine protease
MGSGVLVDEQVVLTNWHVVRDNPSSVEVRFGGKRSVVGKFIAADNDWDVAIIAVAAGHGVKPVRIANRNPGRGDGLTIAGYGPTRTVYREQSGQFIQYLSPAGLSTYELIELSATARDGDSGGPILNSKGEVAGILFGTVDGTTSGCGATRLREILGRPAVRLKGIRCDE